MKIYEYRGVKGLVYAPVISDTSEEYVTGEVKQLAGVAEVSRSTDSNNDAHYYDNMPAIVISSTGKDEVTINTSAIPLSAIADINGQYYDAATGMMVEQERAPGYFALGYITETTEGDEIYVWRLKGSFGIPDQTNTTKDDGTDANGQELTFTGIATTYKFESTGKGAKAINVDTSINQNITESSFFATVQTPDSLSETVTPSIDLTPSSASVAVGDTVTLTATAVPAGAAVTWVTSAPGKATVRNGVVTGVEAGSATITARITVGGVDYTDTCSVTVS